MYRTYFCFILMLPVLMMADTITLKSTARVKGFFLFLRDVAAIQGNKKLQDVYLGKLPPPGEAVTYSREIIASKVEEHGIDIASLSWEGAEAVEVEALSLEISPDNLVFLAREFLKTSLSWPSSDVSCDILSNSPVAISVPAPAKSLKITPRFPSSPQDRGRVAVEVIITVDDEQVKRVPLMFQVRVTQTVLLTKRPLPRNAVLSPSDVTMRRMEITNLSDIPVASFKELRKKQSKYALPINHVITFQDIEEMTAIRRGTSVTVLLETANLKISVPAQSLENGRIGDVIRLLNLSSNKIIRGKVVNESKVVLVLGE